jgi:(2Fe-2S) ferredoxin
MTPIKFFLSIAIFTGLLSCRTTKNESNNYVKHSISLQKTACFGTCPQYTFTLNGKGEMEFNGKMFTKMDGIWTSQLDQNQINEIFTEIGDDKLMDLADEYPSNYSDLPSSIITYNNGEKTKTIRVEGTHPAVLDVVIKKLELKIDSASWTNQNTF